MGGEPVTAELPSGVRTGGLYTFAPGPGCADTYGVRTNGLYNFGGTTAECYDYNRDDADGDHEENINGWAISGAEGEGLGLRACVRGVVIDGERKEVGKQVKHHRWEKEGSHRWAHL